MNEKPYYDLEMIAIFAQGNDTIMFFANPQAIILLDGKLVVAPVESYAPDGEMQAAIRSHLFAEVCVPHHEESAIYGLTFHIVNKPNHHLAIIESLCLKEVAAQIIERYRDQCRLMDLKQPTGDHNASTNR